MQSSDCLRRYWLSTTYLMLTGWLSNRYLDVLCNAEQRPNIVTVCSLLKDDKPEQIKHELIQYSVRTINNSQVSRKTYPRKMHALYEKTSLYESDSAIFGAD